MLPMCTIATACAGCSGSHGLSDTGCLTEWSQRHTAMASLTLASLSADMATEEVLCLEAACAAADAAAFLLPFLPPAIVLMHKLQPAFFCART